MTFQQLGAQNELRHRPRMAEELPECPEIVRPELESSMTVHAKTACLQGIDGIAVRVEVDLLAALPAFQLVGLPHNSVRESRERVRSAIKAQNFDYPRRRITVNLAPADQPKRGTGFDLPIALGVLGAAHVQKTGQEPWGSSPWALGELGLDGRVRGVRGALPIAEAARSQGAEELIVSVDNAAEASLVPGLSVRSVTCLGEAWEAACGRPIPEHPPVQPVGASVAPRPGPDLAEVCDQPIGRRVLEVAAAGGHGLLLEGPPGAGKSMLARRMAGLLPDLDPSAALEVTRIRSASGLLSPGTGLVRRPPFRAPHHSASVAALIGGGHPIGPGEISLAHRGLLFLDEVPEFQRNALEALRQPLEDGYLSLVRARQRATFPASFLLVATRNPCPCGFSGSSYRDCSCLIGQRERYQRRLSGPLLDRIDLLAWIEPVAARRLMEVPTGESTATVRARVEAARKRQEGRWAPGDAGCLNGKAPLAALLSTCSHEGRWTLEEILERGHPSTRRILHLARVARTLADLAGDDRVDEPHVREADLLCADLHSPTEDAASAHQTFTSPRPPRT